MYVYILKVMKISPSTIVSWLFHFYEGKLKSSYDDVISAVDPIYQPLRSGRIWHKVNFLAEFNKFEFRVLLLLD